MRGFNLDVPPMRDKLHAVTTAARRPRARAFVDSLASETREALLARGTQQTWAAQDVVYRQGEPGDSMAIIMSGRLAAHVTSSTQNNVTLWVGGAGQVVGELALVRHDHTRTSTVTAVEASTTLSISKDVFEELRRSHDSLTLALFELLAARVDRLSRRVAEAHHDTVDTRVAKRLLELHRVYHADEADVVLPFTQDDLAGMAGATRPSVNQALRALEALGIIRLGRGRVEIVDLAALNQRAQ